MFLSLLQTVYTLLKRSPLKWTFWDFRVLRSTFVKFLKSILKQQVDSSSTQIFLQILNHSSVSCKIAPLYLGTYQSANFWDFRVLVQNSPKLSFLKQRFSFSSKFASFFSDMRHNSSVPFFRKFHIPSKKGASKSTNLVKFHLSSQTSGILHFDGLLCSNDIKFQLKKYRRVISHNTEEWDKV